MSPKTTDTEPQRHAVLERAAPEHLRAGSPEDLRHRLPRAPLHHLFEQRVESSPAAPAVTFGEHTVGYGELNVRANRLAHALRRRGVGPEVPVALLLDRGVEMVVAILAVLKAGGAYVPLDPAYPPQRLAYVIRDSGAALVLTQRSLAGLLEAQAGLPPRLVLEDEDLSASPVTNPPSSVGVENLAYVIYTSGSTGQPKGVLIPHSHPVDLFAATEPWFRPGPADVWSLFHSFAFDFSVWELWGALLYGGRVVVVSYEVSRSPEAFQHLLHEQRVTMLSQTPSAFQALMRAQAQATEGHAEEPWALRAVVFGGEALEPRSLEPWVRRHGDRAPRLINMYGITETTVHVTYRPLRREDVLPAPHPTRERGTGADAGIGTAIPDQHVHLLDAGGDRVVVGVAGELCVGGGRLARGYWGRPALTAERFVPDRFAGSPGARLYRSGDLARERGDGSLDYLGRIDHQIKLRGFRIEAGEVEAALLEHPAVSAAVVLLRTDDEARLVAYLVVPDSAPPEVAAQARELALGRLPAHMVPAAYVRLAELPLTANGKVDRQRLPAPGAQAVARAEIVPPRPGIESALAAIWEEVLEIPQVGRDDHFLALGGHSLNATRVLSRVSSRLGVRLGFVELMAHPRLAEQAARIEELRAAAGESPAVDPPAAGLLVGAEDSDEAPLSYAQERMWLHQQLHPESNAFHLAFALELEGRLDAGVLAAALEHVERRHRTLRTRFFEQGGAPRGSSVPPAGARAQLPAIDLGALEPDRGRGLLDELVVAAQARPFDLGAGRLLRCRLLRLAPRRHVLLLVVHHIACDGWSLGPFVRELSVLYTAGVEGGPTLELAAAPGLPELPLQYSDFARWQRAWLASPAARAQVELWRRRLAEPEDPRARLMPEPVRDPGRATAREHPVLLVQRSLDGELVDALDTLARRHGTTLFSLLTATLYALLHRYTGARRLTIGTLVAGRTQEAVENLVGCFINTLPLRCEVSGELLFEELLARARAVAEEAYDHQDVPFERLVHELGAAGAADGQALFQVLVAYQSVPLEELTLPGLAWRLLETPAGRRQAAFDFVFFFRRQGERLALVLEVDGGRFSAATGEAMAGDLVAMLEAVAPSSRSTAAGDRSTAITIAELPLPSGRRPRSLAEAGQVAGKTPEETAGETAEEREESEREAVRRRVEDRHEELSQRRSDLSAAKRALLARKLQRGRASSAGSSSPGPSPGSSAGSSAGSAAGAAPGTGRSARAAIPRREGTAPAPLSFTQERLWFLQQLEPESSAYNLVDAFRLDGELRVELMSRALGVVVERQQILRTAFETATPVGAVAGATAGATAGTAVGTHGTRPVQRVLPARPRALPVVDLSRLGDEAGRRRGEELVAAEGRRPFDLAQGEPLRAFMLRWSPRRHGLVFDMHHVVADAWAFFVLVRELTEIYRALETGRAPSLPPLTVQYADFAAWQRRRLDGVVLEREVAWWRRHLAGAPDLLELPADRPRPALRSGRGGVVQGALPAELGDRLRHLARQRGATLFMTLLAGFEALIHRLTGARDFLLGSPSTFRDRVELEALVGVFVNTLVLRADIAGDPGFGELVERVRRDAVESFSHQDLPFEKLVEELRPTRDLSHSPLVQVVFVLENTPRADVSLPGVEIAPLDAAGSTAKFDLTLTVRETSQGLAMAVEYSRDLFDRASAEALSGWWGTLLAAAVENPDVPVSRLPLLGESDRRQVLAADAESLPVTGASDPATLGEAFLRQVRRDPRAPALSCDGVTLSYGELERRSARLARRIAEKLDRRPSSPAREAQEAQEAREARVGLCLDRGIDLVVALLAIVRAGGAYVPLDPSYPAQRLRWIIADAGVELVVADAGTARALLASDAEREAEAVPAMPAVPAMLEAPAIPEVLLVDGGSEGAEDQGLGDQDLGENAEIRARPVHPESAPYVIYTSGSTGRPKGVLVSHRQVLRLFQVTRDVFGFGAGDVWTLFHSCSFDFSVWELWGALLHGGRLVVVPYAVSRSPEACHRLLREERVTVLNQTPSAFQGLVRADGEVGEAERRALALRWVIFGGEALDPAILEPWWQRRRIGESPDEGPGEGPALVNMYGITETTVHVTHQLLTPSSGAGDRAPAAGIGRSLADLSLRVLDPRGEPQPPGVPGEICVGGAGVARGYLGRPALTAARFVPDPWSPCPGGRLYRSGDRARRRRDGALEYLGRLDHQVKVRGFRIEVGEIEAALTALPWIAAAAVTVRQDDVGGPRLAAYLVPGAEAVGETPERLVTRSREALRRSLPEHMVPSAFARLDALPLTVNGKVDRARLPAPDAAALAPAAPVAPRDDLEEAIAAVWSEVLGLPRVGVEDSFFDLGGHSLLLVEVHGRLRRELDAPAAQQLTMLDLFRFPTVASLAGFLGAGGEGAAGAGAGTGTGTVAERYSRAEQRKQSLRRRGRRRTGRHGGGERDDS